VRVFSVLASPRIKGNTSVVLKRFLEGVRENHSGVEE
jgi:multimeric flavodoxin WrbA